MREGIEVNEARRNAKNYNTEIFFWEIVRIQSNYIMPVINLFISLNRLYSFDMNIFFMNLLLNAKD